GFTHFVSNTVTTVFSFTSYLGACSTSGTYTLVVDQPPVTPTIINMLSYLTTTEVAQSYQWYFNANPMPGETSNTVAVTQEGSYIVAITNGSCTVYSEALDIIGIGIKEISAWNNLKIAPNPV